METMHNKIKRPIFVVGSPRSGTSILTWCLGQHPNILAVPESNWMGDFVANTAVVYQVGAARGHLSILSAMDISRDELLANFGRTINDLILSHQSDLEKTRAAIPTLPEFMRRSCPSPKMRWVDGTPEYSFHIYALKKLFPEAVFIHVLRNVGDVVRSILNLHRLAGVRLVANEEEAYRYWIRTVNACVVAERAYGGKVVHRTRYTDLIEKPEPTIRSLLEFLGEPYTAKCLEPLAHRINSSDVPADFIAADPATDAAIVEEATRLSGDVEENEQPAEASRATIQEMEDAFAQRVQYMATLESQYQGALQLVRKLEQAESSSVPSCGSR
jgi:hypothetical protein